MVSTMMMEYVDKYQCGVLVFVISGEMFGEWMDCWMDDLMNVFLMGKMFTDEMLIIDHGMILIGSLFIDWMTES